MALVVRETTVMRNIGIGWPVLTGWACVGFGTCATSVPNARNSKAVAFIRVFSKVEPSTPSTSVKDSTGQDGGRKGRQLVLVFSYGFLGQFAEEGKGVRFVVGGLHHHEDGHADEHQLNEAMEMKARSEEHTS